MQRTHALLPGELQVRAQTVAPMGNAVQRSEAPSRSHGLLHQQKEQLNQCLAHGDMDALNTLLNSRHGFSPAMRSDIVHAAELTVGFSLAVTVEEARRIKASFHFLKTMAIPSVYCVHLMRLWPIM